MGFQTTFTIQDTEEFNRWFSFYPKFENMSPFRFSFHSYGYFDPRPEINTNVTTILSFILPFISLYLLPLSILFVFYGWGNMYIKLPYNTGKNEFAENPEYGFYTLNINPANWWSIPDNIVLRWGKIYKSIDFPWALKWVRTSILLDNGRWEHEYKGNHKDFFKDEWKQQQYMVEYNYTDNYDGEIIPTKVYIEEREWRRNWLMWTTLFNRVNKTIDVHFSKEVGSRKGSWKGGTIGCGYTMKKDETALECIKRMEKERNFR